MKRGDLMLSTDLGTGFPGIREFIQVDVADHLASRAEADYPDGLVARLRAMGVFGANIPREYGGLALGPADVAGLSYDLARGWQSLASLVGTHLKLSREVLRSGTTHQKDTLLPAMAAGRHICARAYHEKGRNDPELLRTSVEYRGSTGVLNGHKDWVTNARHADRVFAIARGGDHTLAIIVDPRRPGVHIGTELPRPGMLGVSLAEITFVDYEFDPDRDVLGGRGHDVTDSIRAHDMSSYVTRAVASADAVHAWAVRFVRDAAGRRQPGVQGAINLRVGELTMRVSAMRAVWRQIVSSSGLISADEAKVFCSATLHEVIAAAVVLCGGAGYAGPDSTLSRHYRDALALQVVGAPNDALLCRVGTRALADLCD
jgi:alkylation response protein AidB-like acyl-CoA dehydrogenase